MVEEARKWWNQGENMHYLHNIYPPGGLYTRLNLWGNQKRGRGKRNPNIN